MVKYTYLFYVPSINYTNHIVDTVDLVADNCERICYISLNKTHDAIQSMLQEKKVDTSKFYYIDGISKAVFSSPKKKKNVLFLSHPLSLTQLYNAINLVIQKGNVEGIIFDSVSSLTVYDNKSEIILFFNKLIPQLSSKKVIACFLCLLQDKDSNIASHLSMSVDHIQEIYEAKVYEQR